MEKERNAATCLVDDPRNLLGRGGAGENDDGDGRADRKPALVLVGPRRVLAQFEAELADVESGDLVVAVDRKKTWAE